jgi:hypothetical protein
MELSGQHINQPHPYLRRNLSSRGRAATASPPPLVGDASGQSSSESGPVVSQITVWCRLLVNSGDPSPPASLSPPPRVPL